MDNTPNQDGMLAQLLLEQGKMATNIALIQQKLESLPVTDHETRIRQLEKWRYGLPIASLLAIASSVLAAYGWLRH